MYKILDIVDKVIVPKISCRRDYQYQYIHLHILGLRLQRSLVSPKIGSNMKSEIH